jgi:hypothetical protein
MKILIERDYQDFPNNMNYLMKEIEVYNKYYRILFQKEEKFEFDCKEYFLDILKEFKFI